MFEITINSGKVEILTPFTCDFNDIKKEITKSDDCIHNLSTYPNGVIIDMMQYSDKIKVKCNHQLVDNHDGTISIVL